MALCKAAAQAIDHGDKKDETRLLRQAMFDVQPILALILSYSAFVGPLSFLSRS
jgi:hypothetical protein